jgi:hypothetical protein
MITWHESGRFLIVVQSLPDPKVSKKVITQNGGSHPRRRRDGRELFYVISDGKLMAVPVKTGDSFEAGPETLLFQMPLTTAAADPLSFYPYAGTADGNRFLVISPVNAGAAPSSSAQDSTPITVVVNWASALKK